MDGERECRPLSSEEEDLLARSTKRAKGPELVEATMDDAMTETEDQRGETVAGENVKEKALNTVQVIGLGSGDHVAPIPARKVLSYKDKLLGFNGGEDPRVEFDDIMNSILAEDVEEQDGKDEAAEEDPACPVIQITREERSELCKPWKLALIVKLLGKRLGMRFMKLRLQKLWNLQRDFEFIDLENDYYLVRFYDLKDYNFVMQEGPWMIADHYLIMQRWVSNFDPFDESLGRAAVWARIPGLPIEFYNKHFLWRVGNRIGSTVKVDTNTLRCKEDGVTELVERAKFARICVEVDL